MKITQMAMTCKDLTTFSNTLRSVTWVKWPKSVDGQILTTNLESSQIIMRSSKSRLTVGQDTLESLKNSDFYTLLTKNMVASQKARRLVTTLRTQLRSTKSHHLLNINVKPLMMKWRSKCVSSIKPLRTELSLKRKLKKRFRSSLAMREGYR